MIWLDSHGSPAEVSAACGCYLGHGGWYFGRPSL